MRVLFTQTAKENYKALPEKIQTRVSKQLNFLTSNLRYPSLDAKKYDTANDIWQGRIDRSYRFYFKIVEDTYIILSIIPHP